MSIRAFRLPMGALVVLALSSSGCASEPEPPLAVRITWGLNGTSDLPADLAELEIVTCINAGLDNEECTATNCSVGAITGTNPDEVSTCRPRAGTEMFEMDPVLVRRNLPTDAPIRFRLHGLDDNGNIAYVGQFGPIVLAEGERRSVALRMYDLGASVAIAVSTSRVQRFMHTATLLPDGRVLIAGGFDTIMPLAACPPELALSAETRCFDVAASDRALAFDVASGAVVPVRNRMLAARAGHTATALPDGRVMIAGGAARAIFAVIPQGAGGASGFVATAFPLSADGAMAEAEASLEIFDAFLDEEAEDIDRDGDLGRGAFLGTAGQRSTPVPMNHPRFMHAAAPLATNPSRVLLVGGTGGPDSAVSWEVFDNERVGGYGVYAETANRLLTPRTGPSAVGIGERVWIFGGNNATSNAQLADIWTENDPDPNGLVFAADGISQFPNSAPAGGEVHPDYSLFRPSVAAIDGTERALVLGWFGPQCDAGMTTPVYPSGLPTEYCTSPMAPATRSFTVTDSTGITTPTLARSRAFGDVAVTTCFRPGGTARYVVAAGGVANNTWGPQPAIDVFDGSVDGMGAAAMVEGVSPSLSSPRFFQTATGVPGLGVVTAGGVSFGVGVDQLFFVDAPEVLFLPSPSVPDC